jgi:hypothetical protein
MCWLVLLDIYGIGGLVVGKILGSSKKKKGLTIGLVCVLFFIKF